MGTLATHSGKSQQIQILSFGDTETIQPSLLYNDIPDRSFRQTQPQFLFGEVPPQHTQCDREQLLGIPSEYVISTILSTCLQVVWGEDGGSAGISHLHLLLLFSTDVYVFTKSQSAFFTIRFFYSLRGISGY